jgi:hypothetical protein
MAHIVFISYADRDKDVANKVCSILESREIQCWIAPRDVPFWETYPRAIVQAIKEAQVMVLVLSSAANDSPYVIKEVERAVAKRITIFPLLVEKVPLDESLEFCLAGINWLDATDDLEACLEQLADKLERKLSELKKTPETTEERVSEEEPETPPETTQERVSEKGSETPPDTTPPEPPPGPEPPGPEPPGPKPSGRGKMELLSNVKAFFKEFDWKYKEVPGETALRTGFKGKSGSWNCLARTHEDKDIFLFYSILEYNVPEDRRPAAAEYITRANYGLRLGNFEMDFDDGEVRYKTSIDVEGGTLAVAMVKNMVLTNALTVDKYLAGLNEVVFGKAAPKEAITEAEKKRGE